MTEGMRSKRTMPVGAAHSVGARVGAIGVALALLGTGCHRAVSIGGPARTPPALSLPAGGRGTRASTPAPIVPVPNGGEDNLVTLNGTARSVETTASVTGLSSLHLAGSSRLTATGDVVDHSGHHLGAGTLRADGTDLIVSATSLTLTSRLRVQPGSVTVNTGASGSVDLGFSASATVTSGHITFQPPPPAPPLTAAPAPGTPAPVAPTTTVPPPIAITGPVTVTAGGLEIAGTGLQLLNAPIDVAVSAGEGDLSWAGSGSITTARGALRATYLGVRAQQLQATIHRSGSQVDIRGMGLALQAYADGVPQLRVPARVDVLSTGATTGFLGRRPAIVWTPRNLDNVYDMAILSIRPGNAAAGGVHLGLLPMPPMFGGEPHALVGGDTAGLKGGAAVDSLIARHGDDKRSIGYDAPAGVALVLIVQGNFDPITVTVTTN
jgi:hypothetical protein